MAKNSKKRKKIANKASNNVVNNNDEEMQLPHLDGTGDALSPVHNQDQESVSRDSEPAR